MFKNIFKRYKYTVCFLMKSGAQIYVKCQSIEITRDGNDLTGYKIDGAELGSTFYVRISEVAAIQYVRN